MSEWSYVRLGNILEYIGNGTSSTQVNELTNYPVTRIETIAEGNIDYNNVGYLRNCADKYLLKKGDILLSNINSIKHIGKIAFYNSNKPLYHGMNLLLLRVKENIDPLYIYYVLLIHKRWFERMAAQAVNQASINQTTIKNILLFIPNSKSIQRKIAKILSTVDNVIEKTQAAIEKYKAIKQGMLKDLFTRGIDIETGKLRPKYEDAPELYKSSPLGFIPKEWEVGILIDFADTNVSHSFTGGPFGSDLQTKHYTNNGIRIIQLQNIGDGFFLDDYKLYTSEEKANQLRSCNIFPGEIIISKMADPIARCCIIPDTEQRYLMASDGIRLCVNKNEFNTRFVMETINYWRFRRLVEIKATGSTRARIGLTELKEIPVVYPNKIEQDEIAIRIDTLEKEIQSEEKYLQKLQQLKLGLMNDLLTGKKEVKAEEEN